MNSGYVDVFPITTDAFGLDADWFQKYSPMFIQPAYLLMVLLLVISVGILALKRFDNADIEKKLWNIPVVIIAIMAWPAMILGIKDLVDTFNTFLVRHVFRIPWDGFGFREADSMIDIVGWPAESGARLLPIFSYWLIYAFYIIFFFFFAVLGPLVLAKGVLFDEIETFLELIKEITLLFLWQTMVVILVGFIMPEAVSGEPFPFPPQPHMYFLSLILGFMLLFVPSMTRKFGERIGHPFFPPSARIGALFLGMTAVGRGAAAIHIIKPERLTSFKQAAIRSEEIISKYLDRRHIKLLERERENLEEGVKFHQDYEEARGGQGDGETKEDPFIQLSKKAKAETEEQT